MVCPVAALKDYLDALQSIPALPALPRPVFLALTSPFRGLTASGVASVLQKALRLAGIVGQSAKSFRPSGATAAIQSGVQADTVRAVGRWKSRECFEFHYVHSKPASTFTQSVFGS